MKVICDNCRAVYKIPDDKLLKPVNKATCRKCGHRMLIPRPRAGASPDEKTLVTAVPPTPPPAPGRDVGPPTTPMDDDPENTMPGLPDGGPQPGRRVAGPTDDVPLYAATPMPTPDRETRPAGGVSGRGAPPPAPDLSYAGATPAGSWRQATPAGVQRLPAEPARRTPAPVPRSMAPEIAPPQMIDPTGTPAPSRQRSATPAPGQRSPTPTPQQPRGSFTPTPPPMARPAPSMSAPSAPASYPSVASAAHDPSGDMLVAVIGVSGAMLGALVLVTAFATTATALPVSTLVLIGVGMLLAFGGGLSTLLVILTGSRGRRPARPLLAMVFGGGAGVLVTVTAVGLFIAKDQILAGGMALPGQTAVAPGTPGKQVDEPVLAAVVPEEVVEAEPAKVPDIAAGAVTAAADPQPKKATTSGSSRASGSSRSSDGPVAETFEPRATTTPTKASTSGSSSSSSRVAPPPVEEDFLIDEPDPEPEPAVSNLPASVPDDIIDTILRNNLDLKKCFFAHKKSTGTLPARVTVSFQLDPSGKIREAGVVDEEFKGTELDSCLSRTIGAIQMPPSSGATRRVKYPFQLQ